MNGGMNVLPQNKYGEILDQLSKIPFNTLFARSVLELKANGLVWADNQDNPKTVFIANSYGMSLLFGDTESQGFNTSLRHYMLNKNGERFKHEYLQVYPDKWNSKLQALLKGKIINHATAANQYPQQELEAMLEKYRKSHVFQWQRVNFKYANTNKTINIDPQYNIKLIDLNIWERIEGSVIPKYFWKSKENFSLEGIGYALMNGNDIVSIAFSSCKHENYLEIGVETSEKYRGRGFARQVCQELLTYCQKNNYIPVWACRKENIGSYKLAKSLGFVESLILPYYELVQ